MKPLFLLIFMNRKLKNEELGRLSSNEFKQANKIPLIIVLDNVRSLHNIGSVYRTADCFLVEAIYLCGTSGTPPNKEINKTALGATETVNWKYFKTTLEAVEELKRERIRILALEQTENSVYLNTFMPEKGSSYAAIFGNEMFGVDQEIINECENVIEIPQIGSKHSLNIAVSAGIFVWDFYVKASKA
jgi:23S rRNA (guanosine2251-2'-O)-methyltransferase